MCTTIGFWIIYLITVWFWYFQSLIVFINLNILFFVKGNVNLLFREPEKPQIISKHITTEANLGSSAMLETKITGYPKPDIKWYG